MRQHGPALHRGYVVTYPCATQMGWLSSGRLFTARTHHRAVDVRAEALSTAWTRAARAQIEWIPLACRAVNLQRTLAEHVVIEVLLKRELVVGAAVADNGLVQVFAPVRSAGIHQHVPAWQGIHGVSLRGWMNETNAGYPVESRPDGARLVEVARSRARMCAVTRSMTSCSATISVWGGGAWPRARPSSRYSASSSRRSGAQPAANARTLGMQPVRSRTRYAALLRSMVDPHSGMSGLLAANGRVLEPEGSTTAAGAQGDAPTQGIAIRRSCACWGAARKSSSRPMSGPACAP